MFEILILILSLKAFDNGDNLIKRFFTHTFIWIPRLSRKPTYTEASYRVDSRFDTTMIQFIMHCYLLQIQNSIIDKWSNQGQAPTAKISIKLGLPQILFEKLSLWRGKIVGYMPICQCNTLIPFNV